MLNKKFLLIIVSVLFLGICSVSYANSETLSLGDLQQAIDTVWLLFAAFLVFWMQAGFGMVEAGFTRAKNAANILMKNFMDFSVASIAYWAVGFAIMFGVSESGIIGKSGFFLMSNFEHLSLGVPKLAYWIFQVVFAGAAATIVAGAMAERTRFTSYLIYSFIISAIIYPIVGHWIWGGGWLGNLGFSDFAGSTVVHSVGGWAALMGTVILGPRIGKFNQDGSANAIPGHNIPLAALGVFILWLGWFGFNPGSTVSATGSNTALIAKIAVNTNLSAAAGAISAMFLVWAMYGKPDASMTMNGALAGLVAITAPCDSVAPVSAVIIGIIGGILVVLGVAFLDKIHVDDPVGAVPVHGMNGVWGTLAVGLFHAENGLFTGGGISQLGAQALGVISIFAFVTVTMGIVFFLIKKTIGLRVSPDEEGEGLDVAEHSMESYPEFRVTSMIR
jgi:Amt family ammonium transporter